MTYQEIVVVITLGILGYRITGAIIQYFRNHPAGEEKTRKKTNNEQDNYNREERTYRSHKEDREEKGKHSEDTNFNDRTVHWTLVLNVASNASLEETKSAYKKKISLYHPDKVSSLGPEFNEIAQKKSKEINAAYDEAVREKS